MCLVRLVCCCLLVLGMRFVAGYWLKRLGTMAKKVKMTKKLRKRIPKAPLLRGGFVQFSHAPAPFFFLLGRFPRGFFWSCCQTALLGMLSSGTFGPTVKRQPAGLLHSRLVVFGVGHVCFQGASGRPPPPKKNATCVLVLTVNHS